MPATRDASCSQPRRRGERLQRARAVLALAAQLSIGPSAAQASDGPGVAVIDTGDPELARKLRAEVLDAGFALSSRHDRPAPRAGAAASSDARELASIRVDSESRVVLQIADATSRSGWAQQTLERRPGERDSFALRVVEALRARLVDLGWRAPEPSSDAVARQTPEAAPAPPSPAPAAPAAATAEPSSASTESAGASDAGQPGARAPMLWLGAGAGGAWATGGLGALPQGQLGLRVELGPTFGASVTARLPLAELEVGAAEGEANVAWSSWSGTLEAALPLALPWSVNAGVGAGLVVLGVEAVGSEGFAGHHDRLLAGVYHAELGAALRWSEALRLRATLLLGASAPRPRLRFDGREVASLGRFVGMLGLSFEFGVALKGSGAP